jgi:hypothetical protein
MLPAAYRTYNGAQLCERLLVARFAVAGAIMASTGAVLAQVHGHDTSEAMEWIGGIVVVFGLGLMFSNLGSEPRKP